MAPVTHGTAVDTHLVARLHLRAERRRLAVHGDTPGGDPRVGLASRAGPGFAQVLVQSHPHGVRIAGSMIRPLPGARSRAGYGKRLRQSSDANGQSRPAFVCEHSRDRPEREKVRGIRWDRFGYSSRSRITSSNLRGSNRRGCSGARPTTCGASDLATRIRTRCLRTSRASFGRCGGGDSKPLRAEGMLAGRWPVRYCRTAAKRA